MQRQVSKDLEPELAKLRDEFNTIAAATASTSATEPLNKSTQPSQPSQPASVVEVTVTPATPAKIASPPPVVASPLPIESKAVVSSVVNAATAVAAPNPTIISHAVSSDSVPQTPEVSVLIAVTLTPVEYHQ